MTKNEIQLNTNDGIKILADYHTHTVYSHGKGTVRDNIEQARKIGLKRIAITDHGFSHFIFGVSKKSILRQIDEIKSLRAEYSDIEILTGIEGDITGISGKCDIPKELAKELDVVLCGFHKPVWSDKLSDYFKLYFNGYSHYIYKPTKAQIARNTKAYINLIKNNPIDIVTHINYHLKLNCYDVARCAEDYGTVLELSSRHDNLSDDDYDDLLKTNCMFAINSDAHKVENIGQCALAISKAEAHGIAQNRIINTLDNYVFRSKRI